MRSVRLAQVVLFATSSLAGAIACSTAAQAQTVGCADGEREGFVIAPTIAGCSGAWSVRGLSASAPASLTPGCGLAGGDDGPNPTGGTCSAADLCGEGWHVCSSAAEVAANSPTGSCSGAVAAGAPSLFFATRETGNGTGLCTDTAGINNDLFGCGNLGAAPDVATCSPLDRFSNNLCQNLNGATNVPWDCRDGAAAGTQEAREVIKTDSSRGGVLCCPDEDFDSDGIPGRVELGGSNPTNPNAADTDNDGVADGLEDANTNGALDVGESDPTNFDQCGDTDADTCDDCAVGTDDAGPLSDSTPRNDGVDSDSDGICDASDPDTDNDGVANSVDLDPSDPDLCEDTDTDGCDDCAVGTDNFGPLADNTPTNDGADSDTDGTCDSAEPDDDNDGVLDGIDVDPANPDLCADTDSDSCDDCAIGTDGLGPLPDNTPANDGADADSDGACDLGDEDDDNDGVTDLDEDEAGTDPLDADTDDDGLPDNLEINGANPTDPVDADTDDDGICDGPVAVADACESGEDIDADGVVDQSETDPTDPDTDDGGVPDGEEVLDNGTDPRDASDDVPDDDRDNDGVPNDIEGTAGTDPDDPDSDNDGLCDGANTVGDVCVGGEDLDGDGIVDDGETDPNDADTDGGSVSDGDEVIGQGTDPLDPSDDVTPPDAETEDYEFSGGKAYGCAAAPGGPLHWTAVFALGAWLLRRRRTFTGR